MNGWLADKSALVRLPVAVEASEWGARIRRGLVRVSTVTRLEMGFSARSGDDLRRESLDAPLALMPVEYLAPRSEDRAAEVQSLLADRGQHRAASIGDLLIAATAERARLAVLHVDKDFELIASITGQPTERLAVS